MKNRYQKYNTTPTEAEVVRARDYVTTGHHLVTVGGKTFRIYRNTDSDTAGNRKGDWIVEGRHVPRGQEHLANIGQSLDEAVENLAQIAHKLVKPVRSGKGV